MKYFLFICLLYTVISVKTVEWEKGSFKEDDLGIDRAFKKAFQLYKEGNPNADRNSLRLLTIYRMTLNVTYYRMSFIDLNNKLNVIQEYIITGPPSVDNRNQEFKFFNKTTYKPVRGDVTIKDTILSGINNALSSYIKNSHYTIYKIQTIKTYLDYMFIVYTKTEDEMNAYVVSKNIENPKQYEALAKLK